MTSTLEVQVITLIATKAAMVANINKSRPSRLSLHSSESPKRRWFSITLNEMWHPIRIHQSCVVLLGRIFLLGPLPGLITHNRCCSIRPIHRRVVFGSIVVVPIFFHLLLRSGLGDGVLDGGIHPYRPGFVSEYVILLRWCHLRLPNSTRKNGSGESKIRRCFVRSNNHRLLLIDR